ncbi:MAG: hypothetical protein ABID04_03760 [Patescibacteria group bacterium]
MSSLVFPFHDPNKIETKFLKRALPILKDNFDKAFIGVSPKTVASNPEALSFLQQDSFFIVNLSTNNSTIGDHFVSVYTNTVKHSKPDQILHLCTLDRLVFALLTEHKDSFLKDTSREDTPTLYLRSPKAWATHPKNYYAAESMVTEVGRILFGKVLDFTWCHLTLTSQQLKQVLPSLTAHDLVIISQLVLSLKDKLVTKEVDWLSWEDPFIFNKDPRQFKTERENDPKELEKRMNYVLPEINYLFETHRSLNSK